ncbi:MAG: 4Fe-4S binding protein [Candidatus Krumholzibacteria bacterium]|nr:4Fe-4S binding protein [Candidatus Krumholzibacteria bacterium]
MRYIPLILSCLILAAHHSRGGEPGLMGLWLTLPVALFFRRRWIDRAIQLMLLAGAFEWGITVKAIIDVRQMMGLPYLRMALILGGVTLFTALSGLLLETAGRKKRLPIDDPVGPGLGAFLFTVLLLTCVQLFMHPTGLLAERFLFAAGWWEAFWLAIYAGWLSDRLQDARQIRKLRPRVWLVFSVIFFTQLILGIAGLEKLLMTGKLHLPVPALILAGPIFRGGGFFMAILFTASVLLVGPAWCSWLCYIGAWDDRLSRAVKRPDRLPKWRNLMRVIILVAMVGTAFLLGKLGVGAATAGWLAAGFGLFGVGLMVFWSRRNGNMVHCTAYCPMGWLATRMAKISPWRMKISPSCTDCGACTPACRYDALYPEDVLNRVPGEACTLCGDCLSNCPTNSIEYRMPGLSADRARMVFLIMVTAMHAAWIGVARL